MGRRSINPEDERVPSRGSLATQRSVVEAYWPLLGSWAGETYQRSMTDEGTRADTARGWGPVEVQGGGGWRPSGRGVLQTPWSVFVKLKPGESYLALFLFLLLLGTQTVQPRKIQVNESQGRMTSTQSGGNAALGAGLWWWKLVACKSTAGGCVG